MNDRFRRVARALMVPLVLAGAIMSIELLLQLRVAATEYLRRDAARSETQLARLRAAYRPFGEQHLHPFYSFFFPLDPADRLALANDVCSIDARGFRGDGPEKQGPRKLAVILGGSAAFGYFATSNATTISGYLNRLQDEYFFVNAAVPSWNSTQELMRLALEIAPLKPALVIAYDGANDVSLFDLGVDDRSRRRYPPGTPEHFDQLEQLIDEARRPWIRITLPRLFPEIAHRIEKYAVGTEEPLPLDPSILREAAERYIMNHQQMAALAERAGARFIGVFQPVGAVHTRATEGQLGPGDAADTAQFRDVAKSSAPPALEFHDLSAMFDDELPVVPYAGDDIAADTIFIDDAHLSDRGNELVARRLLALIRRTP